MLVPAQHSSNCLQGLMQEKELSLLRLTCISIVQPLPGTGKAWPLLNRVQLLLSCHKTILPAS